MQRLRQLTNHDALHSSACQIGIPRHMVGLDSEAVAVNAFCGIRPDGHGSSTGSARLAVPSGRWIAMTGAGTGHLHVLSREVHPSLPHAGVDTCTPGHPQSAC